MTGKRRHSPLPHWIALVAIFAVSLLPTVSQLLAAVVADDTYRAEICTPQGLRWVSLAEPGAPANAAEPGSKAGHTEHCPLCRLQHDAPPMPAPALAWRVAPAGPAYVPTRFLTAPHTAHTWRSAQPRGPPLLG
ncbi:MAG: DUF2946 domain-containing protein [Ideonella sp. WA131b]|jgi:hypothetical protein|nr:DUF2946 domain-containing protein [Ideonella sp. WA131b]